jgi:hypothetical protein
MLPLAGMAAVLRLRALRPISRQRLLGLPLDTACLGTKRSGYFP